MIAVLTRPAGFCASLVLVLAASASAGLAQDMPSGSDVSFPIPGPPNGGDSQGKLPPPPYQPPPYQPPPGPAANRSPSLNPAERWGAVAYTADGAFGAAFGFDTAQEAERLATAECEKQSTDRADCSRGVMTRRDAWFHIQFCRHDAKWTTQVTTRQTLAETIQAAADFARKSQFNPSECHLVPNGLFHTGGLHAKM
jgi:hypothetical protein